MLNIFAYVTVTLCVCVCAVVVIVVWLSALATHLSVGTIMILTKQVIILSSHMIIYICMYVCVYAYDIKDIERRHFYKVYVVGALNTTTKRPNDQWMERTHVTWLWNEFRWWFLIWKMMLLNSQYIRNLWIFIMYMRVCVGFIYVHLNTFLKSLIKYHWNANHV